MGNHEAVGVSSEHRRSSCSSFHCLIMVLKYLGFIYVGRTFCKTGRIYVPGEDATSAKPHPVEDQVGGSLDGQVLLQQLFSALKASSQQSHPGKATLHKSPPADEAGSSRLFPEVQPEIKIPFLEDHYPSSDDCEKSADEKYTPETDKESNDIFNRSAITDSVSFCGSSESDIYGSPQKEGDKYEPSVSAHSDSMKREHVPGTHHVPLQQPYSGLSNAGDKGPLQFVQGCDAVPPSHLNHHGHIGMPVSLNPSPLSPLHNTTHFTHSTQSMSSVSLPAPPPNSNHSSSAMPQMGQPQQSVLITGTEQQTISASQLSQVSQGVPSANYYPLGAPVPVPPPMIETCPSASSTMFHQPSSPSIQQASMVQYPCPPAIYPAQTGTLNPALNLAPSNVSSASGTCAPVSLNSFPNQITPVSAPISVPSSGGTANYPGLVSYPLPISKIPPWAKTQTSQGGVLLPSDVYPTTLVPPAANVMVSENKSDVTKEGIHCPEHRCQYVIFNGSPAFARHWEESHINRRYGPCVHCLKEGHVRIFRVKDEYAMEEHCELIHPEVNLKDKPAVYHMFLNRSRTRSSHHKGSGNRDKKRSRSRSVTPEYRKKRSKHRSSSPAHRRKRSRSRSRSPYYSRKRSRSRSVSPGHSGKGISSDTASQDWKRQKSYCSQQLEELQGETKENTDFAGRNDGSCAKQSDDLNAKKFDNSEPTPSGSKSDSVGRVKGTVNKKNVVPVVGVQLVVFQMGMKCPVQGCSQKHFFDDFQFAEHWKMQHLLPYKGPCIRCLKQRKLAIVSTDEKEAFEHHFKIYHNLVNLVPDRTSLFVNRIEYHELVTYIDPSPFHYGVSKKTLSCPVGICRARSFTSGIQLAHHWRFFHCETVEYYVCTMCEKSNISCDPVRKLPWTMMEHLKSLHGFSENDVQGSAGKLFKPSLVHVISMKNIAYINPRSMKCPVASVNALGDRVDDVNSSGETKIKDSAPDCVQQESACENANANIPNGLYLLPMEMAQTWRCLYKECVSFEKKFETHNAITKHYITFHAKEKLTFFCGICGFQGQMMEASQEFDNMLFVEKHFQIVHPSLTASTCSAEHYNPKYVVSDWIPACSTTHDFTYVGKERVMLVSDDGSKASVPGSQCPVPHCRAFEKFHDEDSYQKHWKLVHEPLVSVQGITGVRGMAYNSMYINPGDYTLPGAWDVLRSNWLKDCGMISFSSGMSCPVEECPANGNFGELKHFEDHWLKYHVPLVTAYECMVCLEQLESDSDGQIFDKSVLESHFTSKHNDGDWVKDSDLVAPVSCAWIQWAKNPQMVASIKFWVKGLPHASGINDKLTKGFVFPDDVWKNNDTKKTVLRIHAGMTCPVSGCPSKGTMSDTRVAWIHWYSFHATLEAYECLLCTGSDREMRHTACTFRRHLRACHPNIREATEDNLPAHIMKMCHIPGLQYFNPGKFIMHGETPDKATTNSTIYAFQEHFKMTPLSTQLKELETKSRLVLGELVRQKPKELKKLVKIKPGVKPCHVYGCRLGVAKFKSESRYLAHWEFCHRPWVRLYACSLCAVAFVGYYALLSHTDKMHPNSAETKWSQHITFEWIPTRFYAPANKAWQPALPGDEFHEKVVMQQGQISLPPSKDMQKEIMYKANMKCPVIDCDKGPFEVKVDYDLHWLRYHVPITTEFTCALCGFLLPQGVSTVQHLENEHCEINVKATVMSGGLCDIFYVSPCPDKNPSAFYSISGGFNLYSQPEQVTETAQNITPGRIKLQVIESMRCPVPGCFVPGVYTSEKSFQDHWKACHMKFRVVFACKVCRTGAQKLNAMSAGPMLIFAHINQNHTCGESEASRLLLPTIFFVDPGRFTLDFVVNQLGEDSELMRVYKTSDVPSVEYLSQRDPKKPLMTLTPQGPDEVKSSETAEGSPKDLPKGNNDSTPLLYCVQGRSNYPSAKPVGMKTVHDVDERQACFAGDIDERVHSHEQKPGRAFSMEGDDKKLNKSHQLHDVDYRKWNTDISHTADIDMRDFRTGHGSEPLASDSR